MQTIDFSELKLLVVGDVMLDRYWYGDTSRVSPEAPVPVVSIGDMEERPGGAANVALNLSRLGTQVTLIGQVGGDEAAFNLRQLLNAQGIRHDLDVVEGRDTITKLRVLSRNQQLIRLDFEKGLQYNAGENLLQRYLKALPHVDVVILSDYAKGTLQDCRRLIDEARAMGKTIVVDPKGRDFSKYHGASVVTPNMAEFELIAGAIEDETQLLSKANQLRDEFAWDCLLITRGAKGMLLVQDSGDVSLPAHAREVFDVTGAGDTVVAVLAAARAAQWPWVEAVDLANIAASVVVGKLGAASVTPQELALAVHAIEHPQTPGIVSQQQLLTQVRAAKSRDERIVMTNGCFDLIHAGHVDYLQQASHLGDRLVVAVNDDESVARLKGQGRPIMDLQSRMEVLSALACVDWVVAFSEDTPRRLICEVLPDVLVKGADYKVEQIAGYDCVQQYGGRVTTLKLRQGFSTSDIINKINNSES